MRFTVLLAPGAEPGPLASHASRVVAVAGADDVARAAAQSEDEYAILFASGARALPTAAGGLRASLETAVGVLGGAAHAGGERRFGWMLGAAPLSPLRFELLPIVAEAGEAGVDALVRGPVDVAAVGMMLVARALLLAPLPEDPVAAALELALRARAAQLPVICRPSFACDVPLDSPDDRGRAAALRAVAERHPEARGRFRLPPAVRARGIEREVRVEGGRRVHVRRPLPPLTVLVRGDGAELAARRARTLAPQATVQVADDAAAALRRDLRVRGDRYLLVAKASAVPDAEQFGALVTILESSAAVALAALDAQGVAGDCVLIAAGRVPQHVEPAGATIAEAMAALAAGAVAAGRVVRAGDAATCDAPPPRSAKLSAVFLASSLPEIATMTLDALLAAIAPGDDVVAVTAENAQPLRKAIGVYREVALALDPHDPLLSAGANRALGAASGDIVVLLADDMLLTATSLARLRAAFTRVPALGAAFPAIGGSVAGPESALDAGYPDIAAMQTYAQRRAAAHVREYEPIAEAGTAAVAFSREALHAVGGIDPRWGPTRRGIADLVARLRAAGYAVVRCDDAFAHRIEAAQSKNAAALADVHGGDGPAIARSATPAFDPAQRVPFESASAAPVRTAAVVALVVPIASATELERALPFVAAAADAYDAGSGMLVALLLDGEQTPAQAVARVRPLLTDAGRAIDASVNVRIERVADLAAWRSANAGLSLVLAHGFEREAFADVERVGAARVRHLLEAAPS